MDEDAEGESVMSDTLPPLPESDYLLALPDQPYDPGYVTMESGYTAGQMREYAAAALLELTTEAEQLREQNTMLDAKLAELEAATVAATDAELERLTGEPHIDGWPLYSGLPPPADKTAT